MRLVFNCFFIALSGYCLGGQINIIYERPKSARHLDLFKTLKSNHRLIYGESAKYLESLYDLPKNIQVIVATCESVNSRYLPEGGTIIICYESLYQKVYDYPQNARGKMAYRNRVAQNVMFTFWHEIGHAFIEQFGLERGQSRKQFELLADEFATLSMLWRNDDSWRQVVMISALHFKGKSEFEPDKAYDLHPSDELRYQKMIVLLYGFAQKSYSKLATEVDRMDWLDISAQEYYLERSTFWEENLRPHTRRNFFNN